MGFSFSSLVLSGVQAAAGVSVLEPGKYVCKTSGAEMIDTKNGTGKRLKVLLKDVQGKGVITDRINLHLPNSQRATEIGLEQFKALLVHGGHPDPDNPGDSGLNAVNGLTVGVIVGREKSEDGQWYSVVKGYCAPSTVKGYEQDAANAAATTTGAPAVGGSKLPF